MSVFYFMSAFDEYADLLIIARGRSKAGRAPQKTRLFCGRLPSIYSRVPAALCRQASKKTCQRGVMVKRLLAGWKEDYLLKVLSGLSLTSTLMRLPYFSQQFY
jgi:hypothetical protein